MYRYAPLDASFVTASKAFREHNDCTVKAVAKAAGKTYEWGHMVMKTYCKRRNRGRAYTSTYVPLALDKLGITHKVGPYTRENKITLKKFCEKHPVGRYIVATSGHAIAIVDGVVYDWGDKPLRRVYWACRVYP